MDIHVRIGKRKLLIISPIVILSLLYSGYTIADNIVNNDRFSIIIESFKRSDSPMESAAKLDSSSYGVPSHYYENRGLVLGSAPCLHSAATCLRHVELITGVAPILLSHVQHNDQPLFHNATGEPFVVPNVVHIININASRVGVGKTNNVRHLDTKYRFFQYVAYCAIKKLVNPLVILLWGDTYSLEYEYWNRTLTEVPNIYQVPLVVTRRLFRKAPWWKVEHLSDVLRLSVIRDFGGIYLDTDVIPLSSFDDLRIFNTTLSKSKHNHLVANNVLVGSRDNKFMDLWLKDYERTFLVRAFIWNSSQRPTYMLDHELDGHPDVKVNMLDGKLDSPTVHSDEWYRDSYNWTQQYSSHIYGYRGLPLPIDEEELGRFNCSLGEAMRWILYDDTSLKSDKNTFTINYRSCVDRGVCLRDRL